MAEYIEREAFLKWAREFYQNDKVFASAIINAPPADVAPVVRCKDCRYFKMYKCRMGYSSHDDFCSYGERKEGAEC